MLITYLSSSSSISFPRLSVPNSVPISTHSLLMETVLPTLSTDISNGANENQKRDTTDSLSINIDNSNRIRTTEVEKEELMIGIDDFFLYSRFSTSPDSNKMQSKR